MRLLLEKQCKEQALKLADGLLEGVPFTLLWFDLDTTEGNVAFVGCRISLAGTIRAFETLLASWEGTATRTPFPLRPDECEALMAAVHETIEAPAGIGFALLIGRGDCTAYIAKAEREGVKTLLSKELLPAWRAELDRRKEHQQ
ncbi:MAG TPA: hypothetical protein VFQ61_06625 [Polyangiaceae bacterium]|nr:hypothetical protein [Polyangiaceae bacterium]